MKFQVEQADAVAWLQSIATNSVDLCVTDPAYESLEKYRAVGTTTRLKVSEGSSNEWFSIFPNTRFPALMSELYRVLKPNAHCYAFSDQETLFVLKPIAEQVGFKFWKFLVWDKQRIGMGYHYRARHEVISFFEKGRRKLHDLGIADVLTEPGVRNGYPTEKPVGIQRTLIRQSSSPGDLVIDPFLGSGSCGEAALLEGRNFAGCDLAEKAVAKAKQRLSMVGEADILLRSGARQEGLFDE